MQEEEEWWWKFSDDDEVYVMTFAYDEVSLKEGSSDDEHFRWKSL